TEEDGVTWWTVSPTNPQLALGFTNGSVQVWPLGERDSKPVPVPSLHTDAIKRIVFSPDGLLLATGGADRFVEVHANPISINGGQLQASAAGRRLAGYDRPI